MTTVGSAMEIHRLLDDAYAGIEMTPEVQDLKEEMRANLVVRVADLEKSGLSTEEAARRAIDELGDVRSIVDETEQYTQETPPWARNRVRPDPAFVVRTVLESTVVAAAVAVVVLSRWDILGGGLLWSLVAAGVVAVLGGTIVADALRQETTTNYPVPVGRAAGYGLATALGLAGLGSAAHGVRDLTVGWLAGGGLLVVVSAVLFTYLGVTQTNRHKPWVVRMTASQPMPGDRFTSDPDSAARFGLYTLVIWLVALAAFVVLTIVVGWAWSWLAILGGIAVMMLTLARMLFPAKKTVST